MTFAMELALRSESRKLMFVATDGQPDNLAAATQAVAVAASAQIEVIGIGIGHDAPVAQVFERSVSIDGAHELAPALFALLEQRLVA
jgi:cobalamin biosynthesis protein CobT